MRWLLPVEIWFLLHHLLIHWKPCVLEEKSNGNQRKREDIKGIWFSQAKRSSDVEYLPDPKLERQMEELRLH